MDNALSSVFHNTEDLSRQCHCEVLFIFFFIVYAEQFRFNIFYVLNTLLNGSRDFPRNTETCKFRVRTTNISVYKTKCITFILTTTNGIILFSVINIIFRLYIIYMCIQAKGYIILPLIMELSPECI